MGNTFQNGLSLIFICSMSLLHRLRMGRFDFSVTLKMSSNWFHLPLTKWLVTYLNLWVLRNPKGLEFA